MIYLVAEKFIPSDQRRATNTFTFYLPLSAETLPPECREKLFKRHRACVFFLSPSSRPLSSFKDDPTVKRIEANLETLCRRYPLKYPKANRGTVPPPLRDQPRIIIPNGNAPFSNWRPTRFADRTVSRPVSRISANAAALYTDRWNSLSPSLSCNRTFRLSGYHLFTRDSIQSRCYFTRGRNRAKGRAHSPRTRGPGQIDVTNEKKGGDEAERRGGIYIYIHTRRALFNFD